MIGVRRLHCILRTNHFFTCSVVCDVGKELLSSVRVPNCKYTNGHRNGVAVADLQDCHQPWYYAIFVINPAGFAV